MKKGVGVRRNRLDYFGSCLMRSSLIVLNSLSQDQYSSLNSQILRRTKNDSQPPPLPPSLPTNYWPLSYLRLPPYEIKMITSHIPRISPISLFLNSPLSAASTNDRPYSHEDQESQHTQIHYSSQHNHYNTVP